MFSKNKNYIKNIKEFTGFEKTIDFSRNIDKYDTFLFKNVINEEFIKFFYQDLMNKKEKLFYFYQNKFFVLFNFFIKKVLNKTKYQKYFYYNFNISFLKQRYLNLVINNFLKYFNKNYLLSFLLFNYRSSSIITYLRKIFYVNYREQKNGVPLIQRNPNFRYNDPYYLSFKLTKLKRLRRKILIRTIRRKAKLNNIIKFFCLEGTIGLKGSSYAYLVKKKKLSLLRIAYDLFYKHRIPKKYKKFKKILFRLTRMNQYRFSITRRPEYTLWYKKMEYQLLGSKEQVLESLINQH